MMTRVDEEGVPTQVQAWHHSPLPGGGYYYIRLLGKPRTVAVRAPKEVYRLFSRNAPPWVIDAYINRYVAAHWLELNALSEKLARENLFT